MSAPATPGPPAGDLEARIERDRRHDGYTGWNYHSRVSLEHRYVCVTVPKVACTTVKQALHAFESLPDAADWGGVHEQGLELALSNFSTPQIAEMLSSPDWLRFCVVRNPYDRLLSAWKSKIGNTWDTAFAKVRRRIRAAHDYPKGPGGEDAIIPFRDFARFVVECDDPVPNVHWEPQTSILLTDLIPYDVVIPFERFDAEFPALLRRLGAPDAVVERGREWTNVTRRVPLAAAYDRDVADLVHDLYLADFETFGFSRDSWLFDGV